MYNSPHSHINLLNLPEVGASCHGGENLCIFEKVGEMPPHGLLISALSAWLLPTLDCLCLVLGLEASVTEVFLGTILHLNGGDLSGPPCLIITTGLCSDCC